MDIESPCENCNLMVPSLLMRTPSPTPKNNEQLQETPKTALRCPQDSQIKQKESRSRLRLPIAKRKNLFGYISKIKHNDSDGMPLNQLRDRINRYSNIVESRVSSDDKKNGPMVVNKDHNDLLCRESFLGSNITKSKGESDDLNNLLSSLEDLSTSDLRERYKSYGPRFTPPSRAGERSSAIGRKCGDSPMDEV
uniref:Uncharacterized protein n=1 Tax=Parastrongyloides trichosuri TaxID=131310 RepID=A0A0N4ZZ66_PARTI